MPFERVAEQLREQIKSGQLRPGDRLPSGRDLAQQHGVALATAQSALRRLRDEGVATASPRGYVVADPADGAQELSAVAELKSQLDALTERVERLERSVAP